MEWSEEQQTEINRLIEESKTKWDTEILVPLQTELAGLKPATKSEQELALEAKELELWKKEKSLTLKEKGLADFADFFGATSIEDLDKGIAKFNAVLEAKKLNNTYVPSGHKQTDAYTQAEKNGDTQSMIGSKLSKLFS